MTKKIIIINGPNLNFLGKRQPNIYGTQTLRDIETLCVEVCKRLNLSLSFRQSNSEGQLVDWIQEATQNFDAIIINPGAYSHTSLAMMDALIMAEMPIIEVHLSNIHAREEFRNTSYTGKVSTGMISGFGSLGYELALETVSRQLSK